MSDVTQKGLAQSRRIKFEVRVDLQVSKVDIWGRWDEGNMERGSIFVTARLVACKTGVGGYVYMYYMYVCTNDLYYQAILKENHRTGSCIKKERRYTTCHTNGCYMGHMYLFPKHELCE